MFSWICPQCGREVPPSKTECPNCAERAQQAGAAVLPTGVPPPPAYPPQAGQAPPNWQPPPPPVYQPPPQTAHQATQGFAPVQYPPPYPPPPGYPQHLPQHSAQLPAQPMAWPPPQRKGAPPTWLVGGGFALVLILLFGGVYYFMSRSDSPAAASSAKPAASGGAAAKGVSNPLQRSIEVTGLRFVAVNKSPAVKFVVINHSGSVVVDLVGTVTLWAGTSRSDEDAIGTFNLNVDTVEAGGVKEITAPLKTKLKAYEMPDWQNATAEVQISSPAP